MTNNYNLKYSNDKRTISMDKIELAIMEYYGDGEEFDRESGCYLNGLWFSVDEILCIINDFII